MPLILKQIYKTFRPQSLKDFILRRHREVHVLKDINLSAHPGEVLALLGPNGAGKTTLLKILASLIEPDSGTAAIDDCDIVQNPEEARKRIGLVNTNDRSFYWRLTVRQNLEFFASLHNLTPQKIERRIQGNLHTVGLLEKANHRFSTLSAGQRQKLAIARALLGDCDTLLFDEPTNSLDPTSSKALLKFVRKELVETQQKTVIWCTHLLHEAEKISDRFAFLHHGRIIHVGKKEELQDTLGIRPQYTLITDQPVTAANGCDFEVIRQERKGQYHRTTMLINPQQVPVLLTKVQEHHVKIFECHQSKQNIDEIFEHLFG